MGFFSKISSWFKGGKKEDDLDENTNDDFSLDSDDGVENDDFMNELNGDYNSEDETSVEASSNDSENDETTNEVVDEQNQVVANDFYENGGASTDYSQNVDSSYNTNVDNNVNYSSESNNTFEVDQNLTQPNEEIFVEIQNRIKMIREKTEELKKLRQENQTAQQESAE